MSPRYGITTLKNWNKKSGQKQMPEAEGLTWYWAGSHLCKKQMIFFGTCHLVLLSLRQYLEQVHLEWRHQKININFLIFRSTKTNRQAFLFICESGESEAIILKLNTSIDFCSVQLLTLEYFPLSVNIVDDYTDEQNVQNTPHQNQCLCAYRDHTGDKLNYFQKVCMLSLKGILFWGFM